MQQEIKILIASGKGGTGKTTVATNLAVTLANSGRDALYMDTDVENPNGHLFLHPQFETFRNFSILNPEVDKDRCTGCRECQNICRFNAITVLLEKAMVFPNLCRGCGGCFLVCPEDALQKIDRPVGEIESGNAGKIKFIHGLLNIGEAFTTPLIREIKEIAASAEVKIIDAPPGTSCPVIAASQNVDFVLLVAEPTPFSIHDLELALDMVDELKLPHGVLINRFEEGNDMAHDFLAKRKVDILMEIPFDRKIAEAYSRGTLLVEALPEYEDKFLKLFKAVEERIA